MEQENAVRAIQSAINGQDVAVPPAATDMVRVHQEILLPLQMEEGSPDGQQFEAHLQRLNDMGCGDGAGRFSLPPIAGLGSRFITIDIRVLHDMLRHAGLTNAPREAFYDLKDDEFRAAFDLRRLETGPKSFSHLIETDGVSMCVHLKRRKTPEEEANAKGTGRQPPPPKRPRPQDPAPAPPLPGQRVIGGDPGRVNLIYVVESLEDGSEKKYVLTRRSYYSWGGIDQHNACAASWRRRWRPRRASTPGTAPGRPASHNSLRSLTTTRPSTIPSGRTGFGGVGDKRASASTDSSGRRSIGSSAASEATASVIERRARCSSASAAPAMPRRGMANEAGGKDGRREGGGTE